MSQAPKTEAWMVAVESRDARFDGWVTVGVSSTGIYCRPSCPTPVRPKRANMKFFATPAGAQQAGFRACKRCAPDAVPGSPEWNRRDDLVARAIRAIDDGALDRSGVTGVAADLGVSSRHLHRVLLDEVGAGPLALARSRRATAARTLIETTDIAFSEVAFASGFESIRQFNDTVREVFAATPTELRAKAARGAATSEPGWIRLRLSYRPPLDVDQLWGWIGAHAINGVEEVTADGVYRRSMRLANGPAVVELQPADGYIDARYRLESLSDLQQAVHRSRAMLDLDADPRVICEDLVNADPVFAPLVADAPGLRSPADVSGLDAGIRAIIHQQVSVASARAVGSRLAQTHGCKLAHPVGEVAYLMPTADTWASLNPEDLGMPSSRAGALVRFAQAVASRDVDLSPSVNRETAVQQLGNLKGIGPWTQTIIALRGLRDPDVFSAGDLALRRVAGSLGLPEDAAELDKRAERWAPWRSYAMHQLWNRYFEWQEKNK